MEQWAIHMAHVAIWFFIIIFILALIGLIAIVRWIIGLFMRGERAVQSGVENVESSFKR